MHVIKMNDDKSLMTTVQATIYCGENNADTLLFLIPAEYNGTSIADCDVLIEYISPDGEDKTESLECDSELYKGYCQYRLKVDSEFTKYPGRVSLSLDINGDNGFNLKTGDAFIDIRSQCDEEIPNNKKYELEIKVEKNTEKIDELDKKVSDIDLNDYYTSEDVDKKLEDKASTKDLDAAISAHNLESGKGEHSIQQTVKIDSWVTENPHVIEYFKNPTDPTKLIIGELDENGNVRIKTGVYADYAAMFAGYGQIGGEQSTNCGRRGIILGSMSANFGNESFILGQYGLNVGTLNAILSNGGFTHGSKNVVRGTYGNAGGTLCEANGDVSNAHNYSCIADGFGSDAGGFCTNAKEQSQFVRGEYNADDPDAFFIIGNGKGKTRRSNAFTVHKNGDGYFAGDVTLTTESGEIKIGAELANISSAFEVIVAEQEAIIALQNSLIGGDVE